MCYPLVKPLILKSNIIKTKQKNQLINEMTEQSLIRHAYDNLLCYSTYAGKKDETQW